MKAGALAGGSRRTEGRRRVATFRSDDEAIAHWLAQLRDGNLDTKIAARTELGLILEQRGLIDDAGRADLAAIDVATLGDYQAFVFDYVSPKTGRKLKTQSQIHALSYVQSFFRFLTRTGRIALDPARVIKLPRAPQSLPAAILTPEEMRRLLALPALGTPCGFRDRGILEVFWTTGMRIGAAAMRTGTAT